MKKVLMLFLTVLLLSVISLSACGSDGNDDQVDSEEPSELLEAEEEAESDRIIEEPEEEENGEGEENLSENDSEEAADSESGEPQVVAENDAFRVFEPAPDSIINNEFNVRGEARVFEATFQYEFEDGHDILDQGTITASTGAPEWGEFEFTVSFDDVFFETGILILYEESAKDGSRINELIIPLKVEK